MSACREDGETEERGRGGVKGRANLIRVVEYLYDIKRVEFFFSFLSREVK